MQIWFWLTPVVYVKSKMSPALSAVITWNPAYPYIESIRTLFIDRAIPSPTLLARHDRLDHRPRGRSATPCCASCGPNCGM
jgi:hypothetical protein